MLVQGDARYVPLKDKTVHCVVSSPPYFRLRNYQTGKWIGGNNTCTHEQAKIKTRGDYGYSEKSIKQTTNTGASFQNHYQSSCDCGATYVDAQVGQEERVEEYIENMVQVFREVKRVLRDDGTLWLNLGDSRSGSMKGYSKNGYGYGGDKQKTNTGSMNLLPTKFDDIPDKNLLMVPVRVALALQADGWILRSDIIWLKENAFPESVRDRPTRSYEHVFLLTKKPHYFYDADAIAEPFLTKLHKPGNRLLAPGKTDAGYLDDRVWGNSAGRNKRDVWMINTEASGIEHYATMPTELAKTCILAGTSQVGCCSECGAPHKRITKQLDDRHWTEKRKPRVKWDFNNQSGRNDGGGEFVNPKVTTGWEPTCSHDAKIIPCLVFDPFGGVGTSGLVAKRLGRRWICSDLKLEYLKMAYNRIYPYQLGSLRA